MIFALLRFESFDQSTTDGQSKERYRRIAITTIASAMAKVASIIANLVTVPLILNYLGAEQYGVWITITSVFLILGVADFGIGNGLLNMIATVSERNDNSAIQKSVSTNHLTSGSNGE